MDIIQYTNNFNGVLLEFLKDKKSAIDLAKAVKMLKSLKKSKHKVILIGNGGSAAIAEHMAIDFTKNAKIKAITISGSPQLTTFANDYGYEQVFSKAVEMFASKGDVLIAISSGGTSLNILNAVQAARKIGCKVITFSGFSRDNPLRLKGDINFYVNSNAYGYVEIAHNLLIHYINDSIIGSVVYKIR